MNGWDDRVELIKSQPVALTSARDKQPFEVTPFFPHLSRIEVEIPAAPWGNADSRAIPRSFQCSRILSELVANLP